MSEENKMQVDGGEKGEGRGGGRGRGRGGRGRGRGRGGGGPKTCYHCGKVSHSYEYGNVYVPVFFL